MIPKETYHIDAFMQGKPISISYALKLRLFCTKPWIFASWQQWDYHNTISDWFYTRSGDTCETKADDHITFATYPEPWIPFIYFVIQFSLV